MSRGLVLGVTWIEADTVERVLVAPDPHTQLEETRKAMDRLLGGVPIEIRPAVANFFAPFFENNEPAKRGAYDVIRFNNAPVIVWWKWAYVHEAGA